MESFIFMLCGNFLNEIENHLLKSKKPSIQPSNQILLVFRGTSMVVADKRNTNLNI